MTNPSQQFIADIYPAAKKVSEESGTSLELILAQTAQETGWGQKVLPGTNNLFNVKADASWHGKTKEFTVPEYDENKKMYMSKEKFRVYDSVEESLRDRQKFLEDNPRYAKAGLFNDGIKGNLEKEAEALEKAHYATGPNYAKNIINVAHGPTMRAGIAIATGQTHGQDQSHNGLLREKDKGAAVGALQTDLAGLGFTARDGSTIRPDQQFGSRTKEAVEAFQQAHGLHVDGVAGKDTLAAIDAAKAQMQTEAKQKAPSLLDAHHPAHGMYEQAYQCVSRIDESQGRSPGPMTQNFAGALASAATAAGFNRIDHVVLNDDASRGWAVQGDLNSPFKQYTDVGVMQAIQTPLSQSSQEAASHIQTNAQNQQQAQAQQVQQDATQQQMQQSQTMTR
ncbi:peptidoglycan-binding protein [Luteibacter anthropi]|uniref:XVIPCD domain-containing protein n=1 Tax=Luteibacter anthropi TaxID=564369 RepID=UPI002032A8B2|nr:XVIPCD domain-containing protein [Luteibacter anthropi]URX62051.1 peptidoglycan-binding protein [Luteibacter anthropi]